MVFKKAFDFFLFSSLFVAVCAIVMVWQTYHLFHLPLFYTFIYFVFFGTLCSYNFHWYLTPDFESRTRRVQWAVSHKIIHLILFIISAAGAVVFFYQLRQYWLWLIVTTLATFLYSAPKLPFFPFVQLRKIAVAKTLFLSFAWVHVTTILPIILAHADWKTEYYFFALNRFFLIYPLCILFDLRDRDQDQVEGIRSIITVFDEPSVDIVFWGCLIAFLITTIGLYILHFSFSIIIVLLLPACILALLYYPSKKIFYDYLYYFVLDGLTMLSGLLLLVFQF